MRVALLHLNVSNGPETANLMLLERAITLAASHGAGWIITPETAVQGYFFAQQAKQTVWYIPVQPSPALQAIRELAACNRLTIFLGCAERDFLTGKYFNSCLVIGPDGSVLGRHRKIRSHGDAEQWASNGTALEPVACRECTAGILICADSWYVDHAQVLKEKGADVIIVPAAWPPGSCGPGDCWERCSAVTGLPVWVCNQTGNEGSFDFSRAESMVVAGGKSCLTYSGLRQAVLLFDWDCAHNRLLSSGFVVIGV